MREGGRRQGFEREFQVDVAVLSIERIASHVSEESEGRLRDASRGSRARDSYAVWVAEQNLEKEAKKLKELQKQIDEEAQIAR